MEGEKTEHPDIMSRSRSTSESSDNVEQLGLGGMCEVGEVRRGVSYDMDGKFSYSQVSAEEEAMSHDNGNYAVCRWSSVD